jgi:hypothetical protein
VILKNLRSYLWIMHTISTPQKGKSTYARTRKLQNDTLQLLRGQRQRKRAEHGRCKPRQRHRGHIAPPPLHLRHDTRSRPSLDYTEQNNSPCVHNENYPGTPAKERTGFFRSAGTRTTLRPASRRLASRAGGMILRGSSRCRAVSFRVYAGGRCE